MIMVVIPWHSIYREQSSLLHTHTTTLKITSGQLVEISGFELKALIFPGVVQ